MYFHDEFEKTSYYIGIINFNDKHEILGTYTLHQILVGIQVYLQRKRFCCQFYDFNEIIHAAVFFNALQFENTFGKLNQPPLPVNLK